MKKRFELMSLIVLLGFASTCLALDPILIGNFEDGSTGSAGDIRWDNWMGSDDNTAVTVPAAAVTLGTHSLAWVDSDGGWGATITNPLGEYGGMALDANPRLAALVNEGAALSFDITAVPGEITDYAQISLFLSADGFWGDDVATVQNVIIDGMSHTYVFYITDTIRNGLLDALGGWGGNIGLLLNTTEGASATLYVDNIWIYPDGPINVYGPYEPSAGQEFNAGDPDFVDFILHWKAGQDPGDPNRLPDPNVIYPVNPDIVNEYIFRTDGSGTDPNLYYVGATGVDPGLYDPNSEYGPVLLPINSIFSWTVVEAIDGYAHNGTDNPVLTVGTSTLDDVDPNNIVGPKWTFATLSTVPEIDTQPVSTRLGVNDASAEFTIAVTSNTTPLYQWFYSTDAVIDAGDNAINATLGGDTDTLTITAHNKAYQAYYYCRVANASTVSGGLGGTEPDVYSDVVSLVVERKVAEYLFDGNLSDTSGEGNNGSGVGSPAFVAGVDGGSALSLNGSSQYVELVNPADPNNFNKCFPRADLLAEGGIGGGLDTGTVMCWIKLNATAADQVSPIMSNGNGGWPVTIFQFEVPTDSAAANTNLRTVIWGDDETLTMIDVNPVWADPFSMGGDGQWHMLAAAWDRDAGTMKAYLDGNLLATWGSAPSAFSAWDNSMTIGFDGTNYFGGLIDNLKVYNYEVTAEDIVQEYYDITGNPGCIYTFPGSNMDVNQLGSSYCKLDLADFAEFVSFWLNDGFYTPAP